MIAQVNQRKHHVETKAEDEKKAVVKLAQGFATTSNRGLPQAGGRLGDGGIDEDRLCPGVLSDSRDVRGRWFFDLSTTHGSGLTAGPSSWLGSRARLEAPRASERRSPRPRWTGMTKGSSRSPSHY